MFFSFNFFIKLFFYFFLLFSFSSYSSDKICNVACATVIDRQLEWMPLVSSDGVEAVVRGLKGSRYTTVSYSYFLHIDSADYRFFFNQCQNQYGASWVPVPIEGDRRPYYIFRYYYKDRTIYAPGYSKNYTLGH